MNTKTKKPEEINWAKIEATLDRATALSEKNEEKLAKLEETVNKAAETVNKAAETANKAAETANRTSETVDRMAKEHGKSMAELRQSVAETTDAVRKMTGEVKGIGNSNGMVAEDYFFESLNKTKTLGGIHYDIVKRNMTAAIKLENGKTLDDEYDTVMINDTVVCVVEVKYKVERKDVKELAKIQARNFKKLFPMYAGYKIYLAVGGLTFQKGAVDAAKELGMGVLRLKGNAVEIYDKDLKAY